MLTHRLFSLFLTCLLLLTSSAFAEVVSQKRIQAELISFYDVKTQVLTIPKLGVASGGSGYAYSVNMKLFSTDPVGFVVSNLSLSGNIAADEEISALYNADTHSIYFPVVVIVNEDGSQTELPAVSIAIGGDPFVWFYAPATSNTSTTATDTGPTATTATLN